jgi:hypothetical protein
MIPGHLRFENAFQISSHLMQGFVRLQQPADRSVSKVGLYQGMASAMLEKSVQRRGFKPLPSVAKAVISDRNDGTTGSRALIQI